MLRRHAEARDGRACRAGHVMCVNDICVGIAGWSAQPVMVVSDGQVLAARPQRPVCEGQGEGPFDAYTSAARVAADGAGVEVEVCGFKDLGLTASNAALWVLLLTPGTEREMLTATTQERTPKILVQQDFQHRVHAQLDACCLALCVQPVDLTWARRQRGQVQQQRGQPGPGLRVRGRVAEQ
jgi:hypothetical protein